MRRLLPILVLIGLLGAQGLVRAQTPAHDSGRWHPPGFGHEHGAPPPDELVAIVNHPSVSPYFGDFLDFAGDFSTSEKENTLKHAGMKGYLLTPGYTDVTGHKIGYFDRSGRPVSGYVELHMFSNPMDRQSQKHSARVAIKDADGGWTLRQGHVNTGDVSTTRHSVLCTLPADPRVAEHCAGVDSQARPALFGVDQAARDGSIIGREVSGEQWYFVGLGFSWGDFFNATTLFVPGEAATDTDPHLWHTAGMGDGTLRQLDLTACDPYQANCSLPRWLLGQGFITDVDGNWVWPGDPECSTAEAPTEKKCLYQFVSPTYHGIMGNAQVDYPNPPGGVVLPN